MALDVVEGKEQDHRELIDERRLEGGESVLCEPDQRRRDRLVGAAFSRERDSGWRRHQDEARLLVAGIVERIEPTLDERIVECADRQQALSVDFVRKSERGKEDEQIHLGDAELNMLALRRKVPIERRGYLLALEGVGQFLARKQAAAVDPGAEISRDGDIGRGRDNAFRDVGLPAAELIEQRAEARLRRHDRLDCDR